MGEVSSRFHRGRMVSILPKSAFTLLLLYSCAVLPAISCMLFAIAWLPLSKTTKNEQVDMVRGYPVIEDIKTITLFGLE